MLYYTKQTLMINSKLTIDYIEYVVIKRSFITTSQKVYQLQKAKVH